MILEYIETDLRQFGKKKQDLFYSEFEENKYFSIRYLSGKYNKKSFMEFMCNTLFKWQI